MSLERLKEWRRKRQHRKAYRAMVKQWYADGGDYRFRFDYPLSRDSLVLDFGGYEGQWASDLYSRYRCKIKIFEPVGRFADAIARRFSDNDDIDVIRFGLGGATTEETIHVCGASSSLYKQKSDSETIRIVDAADWFKENGIGSVQLVKINIEGGEFELLERMIEAGLTDTIDDIQVQFHNIAADSGDRMERIQRELEKTHELTYQYRFVWENWKRKRV